jgi:hypothetical protein
MAAAADAMVAAVRVLADAAKAQQREIVELRSRLDAVRRILE